MIYVKNVKLMFFVALYLSLYNEIISLFNNFIFRDFAFDISINLSFNIYILKGN